MPRRCLSLLFLSLLLLVGQSAAAPYVRLPAKFQGNTREARIARSQERLERRQGSETTSAWAPAETKLQTYNVTTSFGTEVWQCVTVLTPTTSSSGEMEYEEDQSCTFTLITDPGVDAATLPAPSAPSGVLSPVSDPLATAESVLSLTPTLTGGAAATMVTSIDSAGDSTFLIPAAMTSALGLAQSASSGVPAGATTLTVAGVPSATAVGNPASEPSGQAGDDGASIVGTSSIPLSDIITVSIISSPAATANPSAQLSSILLPSSSASVAPNAGSQLASILFSSSSVSLGTALAANAAPSPSASGIANSGALQAANDTTTAAAVQIPGQTIQVLPIGLGVFAGIMVIALIVVGIVTFERTQYRKAFRARKMAEQGGNMGYGGMAERA